MKKCIKNLALIGFGGICGAIGALASNKAIQISIHKTVLDEQNPKNIDTSSLMANDEESLDKLRLNKDKEITKLRSIIGLLERKLKDTEDAMSKMQDKESND